MAELGIYLISSILGAGYLFNQHKTREDSAVSSNKSTQRMPRMGDNIYQSKDLFHARQEEAKRATLFMEAGKNPIKTGIIPMYYNTLSVKDDTEKIANATFDPELIYKVLNNLDSETQELIEQKSRLVVGDSARQHDPEWGITMDRPAHSRAVSMDPLAQIGGSLTGSKEDFTHNNMVPFYGSSITQDLRTENRAKDGVLELYTGQFKLNQQQKTEREPLFAPVKELTNLYGAMEQRDMTRYFPSNLGKKNNETPNGKGDQVNVGPGLNKGFTNEPSGGFHDTFRILPKPIEELYIDPVVESVAKTNSVRNEISKRPLISQMYKNAPDLLVENKQGERNFRTTGAFTSRKLRPAIVLRDTNRKKSTAYTASAKSIVSKKGTPGNVRKTRRQQHDFTGVSFRNPHPIVKAVNDYGKKGVSNSVTKRAVNKQAANELNLAGPRKVKNKTTDAMRKTRKQFYTDNQQIYGYAHAQQASALPIAYAPARTTVKETTLAPYGLNNVAPAVKNAVTYDPKDKTRTTVKETTLNPTGLNNFATAVKNAVTYDPKDKTRTTVKETTLAPSGLNNFATSVKNPVAYDPTDRLRTTVKETTLSPAQLGGASTMKKSIVYDPKDSLRTTVKETTLSPAQLGGASTMKKNVVYDPNDKTRTTVKETTLSPAQLGGVSTLVKKTIAYDPNDHLRTTVKETTLSPAQLGGASAGLLKKSIVYDPNDKTRTTMKETTLSAAAPGIAGSSLVKKSIVYDPKDKTRTTMKETTLSPAQPGIAGSSLIKKSIVYDPEDAPLMTMKDAGLTDYTGGANAYFKSETDREDISRARMNTIKENIAKGRKNLTGGPSLGHSNTAGMLQHRKMDDDRVNTRGGIKTSNDSSFFNHFTKDTNTTSKNILLPEEDNRLDVRILDAFKQNPLTQSLTSAP